MSNKKSYIISDEILVEFSISARINLGDLEIFPEGMSDNQIKSELIKAFHKILSHSESIDVSSYGVKIHKNTASTRSIPLQADDEEIK